MVYTRKRTHIKWNECIWILFILLKWFMSCIGTFHPIGILCHIQILIKWNFVCSPPVVGQINEVIIIHLYGHKKYSMCPNGGNQIQQILVFNAHTQIGISVYPYNFQVSEKSIAWLPQWLHVCVLHSLLDMSNCGLCKIDSHFSRGIFISFVYGRTFYCSVW